MRKTFIPIAAAAFTASLAFATAAQAGKNIYGEGLATCQQAFPAGMDNEAARPWVAGYMTAVSTQVQTSKLLPWQDGNVIQAMVLRQCRDEPYRRLDDVTNEIAARLFNQQQ